MNTKDNTDGKTRKDYYRLKLEKNRALSLAYYHRNKERINAAKRTKGYEDKMSEQTINPIPNKPKHPTATVETNYTLTDIAKLMGITKQRITNIVNNPKYLTPKPLYKRVDDSDIYDRAQIDAWLPYISNVIAFMGKGKKIKISGDALHIINFMHANKNIEKHCDEERVKLRGLWLNALLITP